MAFAIRSTSGSDQASPDGLRDVFAFLALSLAELEESVEETAAAWERRSYWLKADQFRQDWAWVRSSRSPLEAALASGDLDKAGACGIELATTLVGRKLKVGKFASKPWEGAWRVWHDRIRAGGVPAGPPTD